MRSKYDIFVSYYREHSKLVRALVLMLRIGKRYIFLDEDELTPGQKWEENLIAGLKNAKWVVVIWCVHAKESKWVNREIKIAIDQNKSVIPVLIDNAPLPKVLSQFQWIDLRGLVRHDLIDNRDQRTLNMPDDEDPSISRFVLINKYSSLIDNQGIIIARAVQDFLMSHDVVE